MMRSFNYIKGILCSRKNLPEQKTFGSYYEKNVFGFSLYSIHVNILIVPTLHRS
jgi:hypothetical protein